MELEELAVWLRLLETPGVDLASARQLLAQAGSLTAAVKRLPAPPSYLPELIRRTAQWLRADERHGLLALGDPDYPDCLLQTADPPLLLYLWGRRELLAAPMLAIVGSSRPTSQGRDNAHRFAGELAAAGQAIVSGLAPGIESAAHAGALLTGATIAVVGTGLDRIYPRGNERLGREIAARGLMISEYALGTPPQPSNFARRNRLIAGLCHGCLVVEATVKSGSLLTARLAGEAGRDVFAIAGPTYSKQSIACQTLIRQGAESVESPADVLERLAVVALDMAQAADAPDASSPSAPPVAPSSTHGESDDFSPARRRLLGLLRLMGDDPVTLDELVDRGAGTVTEVSTNLLELELAGQVARLEGRLFQRRVTG